MLYLSRFSSDNTSPDTTSDATLFCGILEKNTISVLFPAVHCVEFTVYMPVSSVDSWVRIFNWHFSSLSGWHKHLSYTWKKEVLCFRDPTLAVLKAVSFHMKWYMCRTNEMCLSGFHVYPDPMVPASRLYSNYPDPKNSKPKWSGNLPFRVCIGLSPISIFQRRD